MPYQDYSQHPSRWLRRFSESFQSNPTCSQWDPMRIATGLSCARSSRLNRDRRARTPYRRGPLGDQTITNTPSTRRTVEVDRDVASHGDLHDPRSDAQAKLRSLPSSEHTTTTAASDSAAASAVDESLQQLGVSRRSNPASAGALSKEIESRWSEGNVRSEMVVVDGGHLSDASPKDSQEDSDSLRSEQEDQYDVDLEFPTHCLTHSERNTGSWWGDPTRDSRESEKIERARHFNFDDDFDDMSSSVGCKTVITLSGAQVIIGQDQFSLSRRRHPNREAMFAAMMAEDEANGGDWQVVKLGGDSDDEPDPTASLQLEKGQESHDKKRRSLCHGSGIPEHDLETFFVPTTIVTIEDFGPSRNSVSVSPTPICAGNFSIGLSRSPAKSPMHCEVKSDNNQVSYSEQEKHFDIFFSSGKSRESEMTSITKRQRWANRVADSTDYTYGGGSTTGRFEFEPPPLTGTETECRYASQSTHDDRWEFALPNPILNKLDAQSEHLKDLFYGVLDSSSTCSLSGAGLPIGSASTSLALSASSDSEHVSSPFFSCEDSSSSTKSANAPDDDIDFAVKSLINNGGSFFDEEFSSENKTTATEGSRVETEAKPWDTITPKRITRESPKRKSTNPSGSQDLLFSGSTVGKDCNSGELTTSTLCFEDQPRVNDATEPLTDDPVEAIDFSNQDPHAPAADAGSLGHDDGAGMGSTTSQESLSSVPIGSESILIRRQSPQKPRQADFEQKSSPVSPRKGKPTVSGGTCNPHWDWSGASKNPDGLVGRRLLDKRRDGSCGVRDVSCGNLRAEQVDMVPAGGLVYRGNSTSSCSPKAHPERRFLRDDLITHYNRRRQESVEVEHSNELNPDRASEKRFLTSRGSVISIVSNPVNKWPVPGPQRYQRTTSLCQTNSREIAESFSSKSTRPGASSSQSTKDPPSLRSNSFTNLEPSKNPNPTSSGKTDGRNRPAASSFVSRDSASSSTPSSSKLFPSAGAAFHSTYRGGSANRDVTKSNRKKRVEAHGLDIPKRPSATSLSCDCLPRHKPDSNSFLDSPSATIGTLHSPFSRSTGPGSGEKPSNGQTREKEPGHGSEKSTDWGIAQSGLGLNGPWPEPPLPASQPDPIICPLEIRRMSVGHTAQRGPQSLSPTPPEVHTMQPESRGVTSPPAIPVAPRGPPLQKLPPPEQEMQNLLADGTDVIPSSSEGDIHDHSRKFHPVALTVHSAEGLKLAKLYRRNARIEFLQRLARRRDFSSRPPVLSPYIEITQRDVVQRTAIGRAQKSTLIEWHERLEGFVYMEPNKFDLLHGSMSAYSTVSIKCYNKNFLSSEGILIGEGILDLSIMHNGARDVVIPSSQTNDDVPGVRDPSFQGRNVVIPLVAACGHNVGSVWIAISGNYVLNS